MADVPSGVVSGVSAASAASVSSKRRCPAGSSHPSKRSTKTRPSPSQFSTNPYATFYEWQACARRALNSHPLSPLKGQTPKTLRDKSRSRHALSSTAAVLDFAGDEPSPNTRLFMDDADDSAAHSLNETANPAGDDGNVGGGRSYGRGRSYGGGRFFGG